MLRGERWVHPRETVLTFEQTPVEKVNGGRCCRWRQDSSLARVVSFSSARA